MSFEVAADAYDRFMGRFSEPLAALFADVAGLRPGQRVLDVGCGPGALTAQLVDRLGAENVSAVDPSAAFVAAAGERFPEVDVRSAGAENLPFADGQFDATLAQLVVHFMADPVAGLREMARVTRRGGTVAACVWDNAGGTGPLAAFWAAVRGLDPAAIDESELPGGAEGQLAELCEAAGLERIESSTLPVSVPIASFDEWWQPFTLGVGPAGVYVAQLTDQERDNLRARCAELVPVGPFELSATAWCVRARA
ncbi:MAG: methyltransferase domain-containing protein [Actinomycetota bacterium]